MTTAVFILARTLHIGSAMLLVALPFFLLVILKSPDKPISVYDSLYARIVRWLWIAFAVEAVSGIVWFWFVTAQMSDQSPCQLLAFSDLSAALLQTQFGQLWIGRTVAGAGLGAALCLVSRKGLVGRSFPVRSYKLILIISTGLLVTLAWGGHAGAGIRFYYLHIVADMLHLLIGAVWPIGLIPMGGLLWHLHRSNQILSAHEIGTVQRFSRASLLAVILLIATGIVNACLMIGSWNALLSTPYGRLLLAKIALVALMIGLGGLNRFYLLPRLQLQPVSIRTFRGTVFAESILTAVVLLIVGMMGMTAPPS